MMTTPPPAAQPGRLLLVPNTLDFACLASDQPAPPLGDVIPLGALQAAARLSHWVAENAKTTRAFLKRVDAIVPLVTSLQSHSIAVLPRPQKGAGAGAAGSGTGGVPPAAWQDLLAPALAGHDLGLISEAGLPAVADPGAALVLAAHRAGLAVVPLSGPSSLVLAVAGSGLNGQSFAFMGYLPTDAGLRSQQIRALEATSRQLQQTQLVIETPYRNQALAQALIQTLHPDTLLSFSVGLTLATGWCRTRSVAAWRQQSLELPADIPAVFAWLASR